LKKNSRNYIFKNWKKTKNGNILGCVIAAQGGFWLYIFFKSQNFEKSF